MQHPHWIVPAAFVLGLTFNTGATWAVAQGSRVDPPDVLSGGDIGFRVEGHKGVTPVGTLVVRIDGKWVEPEFAGGPKHLIVR